MSLQVIPTPNPLPPAVPVRNIPYLTASSDSRFPETIPHAGSSLLRLAPESSEVGVVDSSLREWRFCQICVESKTSEVKSESLAEEQLKF